MTKTFKRFNLNDRSKAYRNADRKSFRTHFKINLSKINDDLDDFVIPDRKHYGKINYKMINFNNTDKINGFVSPKDINGNNSFMTETKNKFYHNTRQTKLLNEFNQLIKEHEQFDYEKFDYEKKKNNTLMKFDYDDYEEYNYDYHNYDWYRTC